MRAELDEDAGFLVPHEDQPTFGLNYQVHPHLADCVWHLVILSSLYDTDTLFTKDQFIALRQEQKVRRNESVAAAVLSNMFVLLLRVLLKNSLYHENK